MNKVNGDSAASPLQDAERLKVCSNLGLTPYRSELMDETNKKSLFQLDSNPQSVSL